MTYTIITLTQFSTFWNEEADVLFHIFVCAGRSFTEERRGPNATLWGLWRSAGVEGRRSRGTGWRVRPRSIVTVVWKTLHSPHYTWMLLSYHLYLFWLPLTISSSRNPTYLCPFFKTCKLHISNQLTTHHSPILLQYKDILVLICCFYL